MIAKKIPMRKANLSSFEGLVTYLAGSQGVANRVGKVEIHNYESSDLRWAVQETLAVQDQNKRSAADKTYHLMVSLAGGEFLTDEQLSRIEQSMIEALGYAEHQRISVVHRDTDNLHFHVAINKVHPEKKTIHEPYNDFKILGRECRKFEEEYGLQRVQRGGRGNKKIDMEEVAGIESLIGWIRRECGEQIKEAKTWEQLYHVLSDHGLEIKLRGNGFVISDGEHHVKASSVDREFSKSALEKRLGAFDQKTGVKAKPSKTYREKPLSKANVDDLFRQYKEEKELQKSRRQDFFLHLAQNRDMEIGRIKEKYAFRRSLIRHSSSGIARRILYRMLFRQMKDEIRSVRTDYARRRAVFFEQNKGFAWADWLKHRAAEGDVRALDALRRRGKDAGYKGNR
ncbi:TPA: relaxase/mobilization nuclease domain-containing protein, partial [Neisseria gonorrhoeae]